MTNNTSPSHLSFIEKAYALGIILVVLGHSLPREHGQAYFAAYRAAVDFIYTFHMPLFFIISGMLFRYTNSSASILPKSALIRSKATRLLVPYICISSLAFPIKVVLSKYALHPVDGSFGSYLHTLLYPWGNTIVFYWFLPTLFILFLFAPLSLTIAVRGTRLYRLAFTVLLLLLFFLIPNGTADKPELLNWTGVLHNAVFFWSGMIALPYMQKGYRPLLLVSAAVLGMAIAVVLFILFPTEPFVLFINAYAGSAAILAIALLPWPRGEEMAQMLSRNSYQIYLFSWFPQQAIVALLAHFNGPVFVYMACSFSLGIVVPIALVSVVRRLRLPILYTLCGMSYSKSGAKN